MRRVSGFEQQYCIDDGEYDITNQHHAETDESLVTDSHYKRAAHREPNQYEGRDYQ